MRDVDRRWMTLALAQARRGTGSTGTNPSVGCLLIQQGRILGIGRTGTEGRPHAERRALDHATKQWGADAISGATAYVTLEPCAHTGKTPPCCHALIEAGISRVVSPMTDPDPRVSSKGFAALHQAGIQVDVGIMADEAREVLRGYLARVERRRPFLTLKLASTLDGRIATRTGESRWITGPLARARVHLMRSKTDGIMIGVGSALADNPSLDVRLPGLETQHPARIVADSRLQTPLTSTLAETAADRPLILLSASNAEQARIDAFEGLGASVLQISTNAQGALSMTDAMQALAERGISTILCEGGGRLAASLIRENLVDEVVWFTAGGIMGDGGAAAIGDYGLQILAEMPRFDRISHDVLGEDTVSVWRPKQI